MKINYIETRLSQRFDESDPNRESNKNTIFADIFIDGYSLYQRLRKYDMISALGWGSQEHTVFERIDMNKNVVRVLLALLFIIIVLNISIPNDKRYLNWLLEEHQISCASAKITEDCTIQNKKLDWISRAKTNTGIYLKIKDTFKDQNGNIMVIKSLGIMNNFFRR
ncbi:hypothetical protein ACFOLF_14120 [Paenibacillus sepulcri]|uniref:Uncharacterized protein n=1 Tax=Paenibacillus sepulcri TaxID=359917 RepID=A0ABS7BXU1_9BACL|nr:hypothetical protein [Paenibacillus sepulcri]